MVEIVVVCLAESGGMEGFCYGFSVVPKWNSSNAVDDENENCVGNRFDFLHSRIEADSVFLDFSKMKNIFEKFIFVKIISFS